MALTTDSVIAKDFVTGRNARVTASFNKLIRTKEYESERVEASIEFDLVDGENMEVAILEAQAQLEYAIFAQLLAKRQITQEEFSLRKKELDDSLAMMEAKITSLQPGQS